MTRHYDLPKDYPKVVVDEAKNVSKKEWKKIRLMNEIIKKVWEKEGEAYWEECGEELMKTNPLYIWYYANKEEQE